MGRHLPIDQKMTLPAPKNIIKMSSVMPFTLNAEHLFVLAINEKPWTRAREVCRALKYNKKNCKHSQKSL